MMDIDRPMVFVAYHNAIVGFSCREAKFLKVFWDVKPKVYLDGRQLLALFLLFVEGLSPVICYLGILSSRPN